MTLQGPKQLPSLLLEQANTSRAPTTSPALRCSSQDPDRQDPTPKQWTEEKNNHRTRRKERNFCKKPYFHFEMLYTLRYGSDLLNN
jgi:hypothetical protein